MITHLYSETKKIFVTESNSSFINRANNILNLVCYALHLLSNYVLQQTILETHMMHFTAA